MIDVNKTCMFQLVDGSDGRRSDIFTATMLEFSELLVRHELHLPTDYDHESSPQRNMVLTLAGLTEDGSGGFDLDEKYAHIPLMYAATFVDFVATHEAKEEKEDA